MIVELTNEQEALIQKQLATGRFADKGDVIGEALQLLDRENKRKSDMTSFREALRASHERNQDLSAEEADELAEEAVKWAGKPNPLNASRTRHQHFDLGIYLRQRRCPSLPSSCGSRALSTCHLDLAD